MCYNPAANYREEQPALQEKLRSLEATVTAELRVIGISGMPEIRQGANLTDLIINATNDQGTPLEQDDILVVTQKIVSKAEGRTVDLDTVQASEFARVIASTGDHDPRHIEVVLRESRRIVKMDRGVLITETHHGLICANSGVDASNVGGPNILCLLPKNPDASAQAMRNAIKRRLNLAVAIIISDSFSRPWRLGTMDVAIGVAGIAPIQSHVGILDSYGYKLRTSMCALGDELASAAEVVMGKTAQIPVALLRGLNYAITPDGADRLLREPSQDLFR